MHKWVSLKSCVWNKLELELVCLHFQMLWHCHIRLRGKHRYAQKSKCSPTQRSPRASPNNEMWHLMAKGVKLLISFRFPPEVLSDLYTWSSSHLAGELMTFNSEHSSLLQSCLRVSSHWTFVIRKSITHLFSGGDLNRKKDGRALPQCIRPLLKRHLRNAFEALHILSWLLLPTCEGFRCCLSQPHSSLKSLMSIHPSASSLLLQSLQGLKKGINGEHISCAFWRFFPCLLFLMVAISMPTNLSPGTRRQHPPEALSILSSQAGGLSFLHPSYPSHWQLHIEADEWQSSSPSNCGRLPWRKKICGWRQLNLWCTSRRYNSAT